MPFILKFLNFQQLLKHILRVFSCFGGANSTFVGYTTLLLSPSIRQVFSVCTPQVLMGAESKFDVKARIATGADNSGRHCSSSGLLN